VSSDKVATPSPRPLNSQSASLQACLVDGDPVQLARNGRVRRRSLLISVITQIVILAALVLVPLFWRTERIALANVLMPMPPYRHAAAVNHPAQHARPLLPRHGLTFCLTCPPVLPHIPTNVATVQIGDGSAQTLEGDPVGLECSECIPLVGKTNTQPAVPRAPEPTIVRVGHLDPAMLIHRVEPVFPPLALQTRREGTVELHAIIATDGSVSSLQFLSGDAMFAQSALDAVRQWRYKPTALNGRPVEVDTHITVIYKLNR
jgi:protein TonB